MCMKITVNRSAKISARCQRSGAMLNLKTEHELKLLHKVSRLMRSSDNSKMSQGRLKREPLSNNFNRRALLLCFID